MSTGRLYRAHLIPFGRALPKIHARVGRDLHRPRVAAGKSAGGDRALARITFIRVGNEEYARQNASFGLTTLCNRHVKVRGARVRFTFRGKSGRNHVIDLNNRGRARIIQRCQDLPGAKLFQYLDEADATQVIDSGDVNDYLCEVAGEEFSAKDFRMWAGTTFAALELCAEKRRGSNRRMLRAIERGAARLGNRSATCRKYYIHPAVLESYLAGTLASHFTGNPRQALLSFCATIESQANQSREVTDEESGAKRSRVRPPGIRPSIRHAGFDCQHVFVEDGVTRRACRFRLCFRWVNTPIANQNFPA